MSRQITFKELRLLTLDQLLKMLNTAETNMSAYFTHATAGGLSSVCQIKLRAGVEYRFWTISAQVFKDNPRVLIIMFHFGPMSSNWADRDVHQQLKTLGLNLNQSKLGEDNIYTFKFPRDQEPNDVVIFLMGIIKTAEPKRLPLLEKLHGH